MPSGKQSKRRRAAGRVPPPPRTAAGGRRQASPRVLAIAAAIVALIIVGVVLALVLTRGSSSSNVAETGSLTNALPGAEEVDKLLRGIPQEGNVLGKPDAPVTLVEYIDVQCPFCREWETAAMPGLIDRFVRPGKLKVESRIVAFIGPDSQRGRDAAVAASRQNKQFNFTHMLYANQGVENSGWLDDDLIRATAASIPGMDVGKVLSDRNSGSVKDEESKFDSQATQQNVKGTPTIYVGKTGAQLLNVPVTNAADAKPVIQAIQALLNNG